jgi:hypothetical protein
MDNHVCIGKYNISVPVLHVEPKPAAASARKDPQCDAITLRARLLHILKYSRMAHRAAAHS